MHVCIEALILAVLIMLPATLQAAEEQERDVTDVAEICARCHERPVALALETGGHAPGVLCTDCHRNRRPGRFGRRHRSVVSCAKHHDKTGHPKRRAKRSAGNKRKLIRNCTTCHEQHGSANLSLVRETIRFRRRKKPVRFDNENGAAVGGFTDPRAPGSGVCEICHRRTDFYRRNGHGEAHFTVTCTICHKHGDRFEPITSEDDCTDCHIDKGDQFAEKSLHSARLSCRDCHDQLLPSPGPGHRRLPDCTNAQCHATSTHQTHTPPGVEPLLCARCHDPHGTDNIKLVRSEITNLQGEIRSVAFGEKGGFVSTSAPGAGICEVCHTATTFFRNDGSGNSHADVSCTACHEHKIGFGAGIENVHPVPGEESFACGLCHDGPTHPTTGELSLDCDQCHDGPHPSPGQASLDCAECHSAQDCGSCHGDKADLFEGARLHRANFPSCTGCHDELLSSLGPGHRRVPDCTDAGCHLTATHQTHAPPGVEPFLCSRCHEPHGSDNIKLVRNEILTPQSGSKSVDFGEERNFVSTTEPRSGICEVCHTTTDFFQNDGDGSPHPDPACPNCHQHPDGFVAPIPHRTPSGACSLCHGTPHGRENSRAVPNRLAGWLPGLAVGEFPNAGRTDT